MKRIGMQQQHFIPAAYIAIFLMLGLAIWNPGIPSGSGPVDLLLLLDESDSITPEHNNNVWRTFLKQSQSLPADSRISLIRFADRAKVEIPWTAIQDIRLLNLKLSGQPPRHRFLDTGASSIANALQSAIKYSSAEHHTAILLSSDGIDTIKPSQTSFAIRNQNPDLALFYLKAENHYTDSGLIIESTNVPLHSIAHHSLPVSIAIKSQNDASGSIEVLLNNHLLSKQLLKLKAGELKVLNFDLSTGSAHKQTVAFILRDSQDNIITRKIHVVSNNSNKKLLFITNDRSQASLNIPKLDGWQVISEFPQDLPTDETFFNSIDVVIMDNLPADALNAHTTSNLIKAVEQSGTGLIVIGGLNSFGSGNYRHSKLETILPVISESARPLPAAAFLFLLDKSGSMDAENRTASRLSDALRAVRESAKSLRPGDESSLLVFDNKVEVLLALKPRADTWSALNQSWQIQASGGTQLTPALQQAINILTSSTAKQRFLILVTDGFIDGRKTQTLKPLLQNSDIRLIALAIGNNADTTSLQELSAVTKGRVLKINHTAELPHLMRQELETQQNSWNKQRLTPISLKAIPFIHNEINTWHAIEGFQQTRAKPAANIYISTNQGDPLFAVQHYGAGRVAVLPGGLLTTNSGKNLLLPLISGLNSHQQNPTLAVTHFYVSGKLDLQVDAIDTENQWYQPSTAELTLSYPNGISHTQPLIIAAPGRFKATMDTPESGAYSARLTIGDQQTIYHMYLAANNENLRHSIVPWLQQALSKKQIHQWHDSSLSELLQESSTYLHTRTLWLFLALLIFLSLIILERPASLKLIRSQMKNYKS